MLKKLKIEISGRVQGVGFRPFIYQLAHSLHLVGDVLNTEYGVEINVIGKETLLSDFINTLTRNPPPLAKIHSTKIHDQQLPQELPHSFIIKNSHSKIQKTAVIPNDYAICKDCAEEILDTNNRRFLYPFTSCIYCGPRYSLLDNLPYDRIHTSMRNFTQCDACQKECIDPNNRRFHSQINACAICGPQIFFGREIRADNCGINAITKAVDILKKEGILALKGIGGFHLVCNALSQNAIAQLRIYKKRPLKPFAVMFPNYNALKKIIYHHRLLKPHLLSQESPIILAKVRPNNPLKTLPLIAPNLDKLGIMLPYSPIHLLLLNFCNFPIICTSANISGEPLITQMQDILQKLPFIQGILNHNREILHPIDDSVAHFDYKQLQVLRLGRGYAPYNRPLPKALKPTSAILALGSEQKNTFSLTNTTHITTSPHIGDLENLATQKHFLKQIDAFTRTSGTLPGILAMDCHPRYHTNLLAQKIIQHYSLKPKIIKIQHHFAHFCSLLGEHSSHIDLYKDRVGVVFDGTGYGIFADKKQHIYGINGGSNEKKCKLWGGEFFLGNILGVKRIGHFLPFKLLGGEASIRDIKKITLSLLFSTFNTSLIKNLHSNIQPFLKRFSHTEYKLLAQMWENNTACIECCSVGRLFDGLGGLLGMSYGYEGEIGARLETLARAYPHKHTRGYRFFLQNSIIDFRGAFVQILHDLINYDPLTQQKIAWKWHRGLADIITHFISTFQGNYEVGLSGGVFCNTLLTHLVTTKLQQHRITTLLHKEIPPNDAGISFGQAFFCYNLLSNAKGKS